MKIPGNADVGAGKRGSNFDGVLNCRVGGKSQYVGTQNAWRRSELSCSCGCV